MSGIRFFQKTETDGRQTLRVEISEDATREDIESAWRDVTEWQAERSVIRGKFFCGVRDQWEFDRQVHKLSQYPYGYGAIRIAQIVNAELLDMLRQYQIELAEINMKPDSEGIVQLGDNWPSVIMRLWHVQQWWNRVDSVLSAARRYIPMDQRHDDIRAALEKIGHGEKLDEQCLIDHTAIRRSIDRWSERVDRQVSSQRSGRKFKMKIR